MVCMDTPLYLLILRTDLFSGGCIFLSTEHSSGDKRKVGSITKAGNAHLRKLLIESNWHYRHYNPSKRLAARRKGQPTEVIAYADKAGRRLTKKYNSLLFRNKLPQKAVTAVARELAGFLWGMMVGEITV